MWLKKKKKPKAYDGNVAAARPLTIKEDTKAARAAAKAHAEKYGTGECLLSFD